MVYVDILFNCLKFIYGIGPSMLFMRHILLNVVFHNDLYWVPYCLLYTLMIYVIFVLVNIMYADSTSNLNGENTYHNYVKNKVFKGLGVIFKARTIIDQQCLFTLYNSRCLSLLDLLY